MELLNVMVKEYLKTKQDKMFLTANTSKKPEKNCACEISTT
jgi:hypothetical protein